jgi:hypothetical protein
MRAVLDWTDPELLKEMLRLRLIAGLGLDKNIPFDKIWPKVCTSHYKGNESSMFLIERSLMRPRNVLKLFSYSRGFANNFSRPTIEENDIEKGFYVYSQDLLVELDHELSDVIPGAKDLLYYFLDAKDEMSLEDLQSLLERANVDESDCYRVIEFLLYYGVIGLRIKDSDQYIFDVNYDSKILEIRAELAGENARYIVNPAFFPALGIK